VFKYSLALAATAAAVVAVVAVLVCTIYIEQEDLWRSVVCDNGQLSWSLLGAIAIIICTSTLALATAAAAVVAVFVCMMYLEQEDLWRSVVCDNGQLSGPLL